ncbi:V-type proton ATPase 116 kDa subunit a1-like [Ischnura elegans]|uniref:V-type proton ATPase 116 kDa subunit a1-like n=1 Tax=Ischnura elegans TaxID=197161 RepID=UPI001ED89630|nr:V-type proton ATPase 116 kDa subunit a1-like [Ischnura elegans]
MGSYLRSEEMVLCELFLQPEAAYSTVADLGESGILQFRDMNNNLNTFQRRFVSAVKSANEMERKLRFMENEIGKDGLLTQKLDTLPTAPNSREILELEAHLEKTEGELQEVSQSSIALKSNFVELTELKHVLEKTQVLFAEQEGTSSFNETKALIGEDQGAANLSRARLSFVAGVIPRERVPGFEKMLWRISRGNVFLRQAEIEEPLEDPKTGNEIQKNVFVAFFQGDQLKSRVKKVCSGFRASIYQCPNTTEERLEMVIGVRTRLADLSMVLNQTKDLKHRLLIGIASELQSWMVKVKKMKAVYHTLNMFNLDVTNKCFIGECWVPKTDLQQVKDILANKSETSGSSIPSFLNVVETSEVPPTFHRTNKFTNAFQVVIDAYGMASYRELNPALYSTITFPFLFGVMFGDCGHGLIVTIFAAWMVMQEKSLSKSKGGEIWNIFFGGRYLILLMGLFSIYTGLIYNDVFSKSFNIFGSSWKNPYNESTLMDNLELQLDPAYVESYSQYPYPFGFDPAWQLAPGNKIIFQNSFKMKLSIMIGVVHMLFGVSLSVGNHVYFKQPINIILQFVPQVLFLALLFLYMIVLMILKWVLYSAANPLEWGTRCAPSVLITFINMMMFKSMEYEEPCLPTMYPYQQEVQTVLVVVALLCIPFLLLGRPIYILIKRSSAKKHHEEPPKSEIPVLDNEVELNDIEKGGAGKRRSHSEEPVDPHEEGSFSDIFILQSIHTIEYILSTISHTASYLRLWALSLAHGQLSEVLWNMVLNKGLTLVPNFVGSITIYIIFAVWAVFTLAILVLMEGLSAFLHTLRLHWVEFMSKFYIGEGYAYQPFSFKAILAEEEKEDKE